MCLSANAGGVNSSDAVQLDLRCLKIIEADLRAAERAASRHDVKAVEQHLNAALLVDKKCCRSSANKSSETEKIITHLIDFYREQRRWVHAYRICHKEGPRVWTAMKIHQLEIGFLVESGNFTSAKFAIQTLPPLNSTECTESDQESYAQIQSLLTVIEKENALEKRDTAEALKLLEKALLVQRTNPAEAEEIYKAALEADKVSIERYKEKHWMIPPENPHLRIFTGLFEVYKQQGKYSDALKLIDQQGEMAWSVDTCDLWRAKLLMASGRCKEAWHYLKRFDPPKPPPRGGFCGNPYVGYSEMKSLIQDCYQHRFDSPPWYYKRI